MIHPPIDLHRARILPASELGRHYLCVGRLVGYKRTELMVEACARLGRELRIAGTGPEEGKLKILAKKLGVGAAAGFDVMFLGELSTDALWGEYAACRALLFGADEDFGMVPYEAFLSEKPVVTTTDAGGNYRFPAVEPGAYAVSADLSRFKSARQENHGETQGHRISSRSKGHKTTAIWRREGGARSAAGNETAAQGQIFLGFTPILNDFGSALVNSYTAGWNLPHSPYLSHSIGPLMPSNLVANTASRSAFLPM